MTPNELEQWKARFKEDRSRAFEEEGWEKLYKAWSSEGQHLREMPSGFELFDTALARLLDSNHSCWHLHNLTYHVYAKDLPKVEPAIDPTHAMEINPLTEKPYREGHLQQPLKGDGARFLYFQPAEHYRQSEA